MKIIGVDIGGTTIKGGIVENGEILLFAKRMTNIQLGIEEFKKSLFAVIEELLDETEPNCPIGISSTGDINPLTGSVIYATDSMPDYSGLCLKKLIEDRYHRKTVVLNDSLSALLGEYIYGAGKGLKEVVMLTLGTGVGGGVISNSKLLFGKEFRASRLGHTTLYKNGRPCPCGKKGCIEAYISAKGLLKTAEINGSNFFDVNEIFTCEDHNLIAKIVEEFTNDLISVIENYNAIFDPEVIIIGGGLIMTTDFWWDRLMEKNQTNIKIVPADLGNDSGIIGIAYLAENNFIEGE